jgi:ornithine decarboxylase
VSEAGLLERLEVAENPEIHPNALLFLQSIYGPDRRLDNLSQVEAITLSERLVDAYAQSTNGYDNYYTGGVAVSTNQEALEHFIDRETNLTRMLVHSFVEGASPGDIAEDSKERLDGVDVEIQINMLTTSLRQLDKDGWFTKNAQPTLEDILEPYAGERPPFPGPLRIIPMGRTMLGGIDTPSSDTLKEQKHLLDLWLERNMKEARQAVDDFAASPEFLRAAERRGHDKDMQTFVIAPEDTDEDSQALRKMSELITAAVFAEKDGNSAEEMADHADTNYYALAVRHDTGKPVPVGTIHGKVQSKDSILLSIDDIQHEWRQPIKETCRRAGLPDLRFHPNVMDIMSVAILPEYRGGTASMALYRQLTEISDVLGVEYFVTVLDRYAADQLNKMSDGFEKYASEDIIPPLNYRARRENANKSLPLFCRIAEWKRRLRHEDPGSYSIMWGNLLTGRCQFDKRWHKWGQPYTGKHNTLGTEQLIQLPPQEQPVLYMDLEEVTDQYTRLKAALPRVNMHYAMKCNPDRPLLEHIRSIGGKFEVASFNELDELIAIGVDPSDVLFSNPVKSIKDIMLAYTAGLRRFAFQDMDELKKLQAYAPGASVYFRMATGAGSTVASEGKFGQSVQTEEQREQIALLMKQAVQMGLNAWGVAFHVGSQMETPDAWDSAIRQSGDLMRTFERFHIKIEMLDIGGGYPAHGHGYGIAQISDFGKVINKALDAYLPYMPDYLAAEPGRALVSDAGVMIAEVIGSAMRDGEWWVYTNVGAFNGAMMEALETQGELGFDMQDSRQSPHKKTTPVTGPSCDSQDTVSRRQRLSANLRVGDRIFIKPAGAYTISYDGSNFNGFAGAKILYAGRAATQGSDYAPRHFKKKKEKVPATTPNGVPATDRQLRPPHLATR